MVNLVRELLRSARGAVDRSEVVGARPNSQRVRQRSSYPRCYGSCLRKPVKETRQCQIRARRVRDVGAGVQWRRPMEGLEQTDAATSSGLAGVNARRCAQSNRAGAPRGEIAQDVAEDALSNQNCVRKRAAREFKCCAIDMPVGNLDAVSSADPGDHLTPEAAGGKEIRLVDRDQACAWAPLDVTARELCQLSDAVRFKGDFVRGRSCAVAFASGRTRNRTLHREYCAQWSTAAVRCARCREG